MDRKSSLVLIVDDSPEDREVYRRYLLRDRDYSYTVVEASLGRQGLELWQQHQPDAVLLDYRLPDLDGLDFLAQLQPLTQQPCLPVIVVTGQGNEAIAVQAMKAGAQDYLVKGQITPEGLKLAVNGAIEAVQLRIQLQQRIEREQVLSQITRQIHQSLDLDSILQTTVTEVRQFLQTDRVLIFRLKPDGKGTVIAESVGTQWQTLLSCTSYDPCLTEHYLRCSRPASMTHEPAFVEDDVKHYSQEQVTAIPYTHASHIDPGHVELLAQFQVKANLIVPILHDNQFWGLLIAHHCAAPRTWQPLEIDLLKELATHVSIALRQAELYQQSQKELAERQQVEAELRESEQRRRLALEASHTGTWDWNIQTGLIQWSDNLEALFGLKPGEFDGSFEMFAERLHPNDRALVLAAVERAIATGEDYNIEFRVVYPNGRIRWALSQGKVFYDKNGQPIRMTGNDIDITERKRSAKALQDSEERFRQLAENIDVVFWIKEAFENRVSYVSPAYERLWGLNPQVPYESQQPWIDYIHPDDRELTSRAFEEKAALSQYDQEYRIVLPNGSVRWVRDRCFPLRDEAGEIYRFAGIAEDITDRKQIEEMVRLQAQVLDQTHDMVVSTDLDGYITSWNKGAQRTFGYEAEEVLGQHVALLYPPEIHAFLENQVIAPLKAKGAHEVEVIAQCKSGDRIDLLLSLSLLRDEHQNPVGMIGFSMNITDRKQTEEALRQSEERYRCLAELIPQLVWTVNAQGELLDVNQRWLEFTGLTLEQVRTIGWEPVVHPEDLPVLVQQWTEAVQQGTSYQAEGRMRRADGLYRWHLHQAIGQKNEQGQIIKWFGTATDIEAQKQLEVERDRLLQLEQTARLEAERANRIKDEFLAILSHELRSPLNPILGWTKLLQTRNFDETQTAEALAIIERNAKLQTQLIDDLLDVAKILRGKLSVDTAPVNLVSVIEAAINTVRTAAVSKSILLYPVLPNIGQVIGDATRLQQIVWNLLSNAIKFTPKRGRVEIRLERVNDQAHMIVSDTGKGINPDFLPHIFDSFRQEDVSTTRKYGGLGLGLAIVRSLVEAHGGTIFAESPGEGKGATFTVRLPLLDAKPQIDKIEELSEQELDLTGIRVLTVDDEPDVRDLFAVLLSEYGAEVLTVASAAEVLATLESFQPDVLVSDIGMPEVDGYTLLQRVRSLPPEKGGQIPAIALTAYARGEDQERCLAGGFQQHISKPIDIDRLVRAVYELARQPVV